MEAIDIELDHSTEHSSSDSGTSAIDARLSIVIPAFNEESGITAVLDQLCEMMPQAEIIVVDDGSSDATVDRVREFPQVTLVAHRFNRGYGAALKSGMQIASREFIAWFDADNEHRPADLQKIVLKLIADNLTAVIGQRQKSGPSLIRESGKWVIRQVMRSFDINAGRDVNCGLRAFRRDVIVRYIPLLPNTYSASVTSTMIMLERGYPIAFLPIELNSRIGVSKVQIRDGFRTLGLIIRIIMMFAPLRIFLRGGMVLVGAGALYGLAVALTQGQGVPTSSVLVTITGFLLVMFGLIADQISQMRLGAYDYTASTVIQEGATGRSARKKRATKKDT